MAYDGQTKAAQGMALIEKTPPLEQAIQLLHAEITRTEELVDQARGRTRMVCADVPPVAAPEAGAEVSAGSSPSVRSLSDALARLRALNNTITYWYRSLEG